VCACATGSWGGFLYFYPYYFIFFLSFFLFVFIFFFFPPFFSFFYFFLFVICFIFFFIFFHFLFHNTCLTSNKTSISSTGYLSAIFMGSAFNNYISYKSLLFSDMLCSTPNSLSRQCWIFCYIFRDLFVFIQHLNHYFVDLLQFCHRCLR
jgi:hypothetical protein